MKGEKGWGRDGKAMGAVRGHHGVGMGDLTERN